MNQSRHTSCKRILFCSHSYDLIIYRRCCVISGIKPGRLKKISGHSSVVERLVANEKVEGSTPFARSKKIYE